MIVAAAAVAYVTSLDGSFVFDDADSILNNPSVRRLWPLSQALSAPPMSPLNGRPVVSLSFALNYAVGGLQVRGYHVVNLAIHILNALLLLGIVRRTLERPAGRPSTPRAAAWLATAIVLVWVVHPLLTDAVTYVTQRTELLMALFLLSTLYCVIRGATGRQPKRWYAIAVTSCALGMASKEVMVVAPVIVLLYDRTFLASSVVEALRQRRWLYVGLGATWLVLGAVLRVHTGAQRVGASRLAPWEYAATQCGVILHYLRLSVWPYPLLLDYEWPVARTVTAIGLPAAAIGLLLVATGWALRRRPPAGFVAAWFFVLLAPTSSVVPIATEVVAERRMYLPLVTVVVFVVLGGHALLGRLSRTPGSRATWVARSGGGLVAALVTILIALTAHRNRAYHSEVTLWSDVVRHQPTNVRARINLGDVLRRQRRTEDAVAEYTEAIRLNPQSWIAHDDLGSALLDLGKSDEAIVHYRSALSLNAANPKIHNNLANALLAQGNVRQAIDAYTEALRLDPQYAKGHFNLGVAFARQGDMDRAIAEYREAVRLDPRYVKAHHTLGLALAARGDTDAAARHLATAVTLDPTLTSAQRALDNLHHRP